MGSTRRNQSNETNQIDSRQIHETITNIDYEQDIEVDNRQDTDIDIDNRRTTDIDIRDESQGNISNVTGNVTVQSENASIAASAAAAAIADEAARIAEANAQLQADLAEQQRRTNEANAQLQERFIEEQRRATEAALESNQAVSLASIAAAGRANERAADAIVDISEEALERNSLHVQEVLDAGSNNLGSALDFLEAGDEQDRKLLEGGFDFLGDTIKDANKLSSSSLTAAFKSTIGGFADGQQKTLLAGLGISAALILFSLFRKSSS